MAKKQVKKPVESSEPQAIEMQMRDVASIKPYKRNAKNHPPEQVDRLAALIEKHGFDQPIVLDAKGVIVKGHGRWLAAKKLGLAQVPVIVRDLPPALAMEARIADNKVAEFGWNFDSLVADVVSGLKIGFDLDLVGFSLKDLGLDGAAGAIDGSDPRHGNPVDNEEGGEGGVGTGEIDIGEGEHECPRCQFRFD